MGRQAGRHGQAGRQAVSHIQDPGPVDLHIFMRRRVIPRLLNNTAVPVPRYWVTQYLDWVQWWDCLTDSRSRAWRVGGTDRGAAAAAGVDVVDVVEVEGSMLKLMS
jgi:hypothetical protein